MKTLSIAERESLMAEVVASGFFDKEEIAKFPDDELEIAVELIEKRESVLDPDTGFMDSDDFTEFMGRKPVGRLGRTGEHTLTELKRATGFVHGEAVKQAPNFLLDLETAAHISGVELAKEFVPQAVKKVGAAVDKVDRFPEVPSDMLRAYVVSPAKTPEGVRADTLKLLENMAELGYHIYAPGGKPDIEDRHDGSAEGYKDIAVKFVKDAPGYSDPVVKEVLVLQSNMLREKRRLDGFYDVVREANKRLLTETRSDRQMTITRTRDQFDRQVKKLSAKAYLEDNPSFADEELNALANLEPGKSVLEPSTDHMDSAPFPVLVSRAVRLTNPLTSGYRVMVDDNFHFMDEDERWHLGDFAIYEDALNAAKKLVEGFFSENSVGQPEDELYAGYMSFGDDPWIVPIGDAPESPTKFSAWDYAKELSRQFSQGQIPLRSPSGEAVTPDETT
jgi:hypothetical protein